MAKVTIELNEEQLHSLLFAVDSYRTRWFDIWMESNSPVDQLVYERNKELCNTIQEQVDEYAQLAV